MEWLDNNAYTRQQDRSGVRSRFGVFAFFALAWGAFAFITGRGIYHSLQADSGIQVEGYVESYRNGYKDKHLEVAIDYQGETYTVTGRGQYFTRQMFEKAIETRRVTVFVNPENPEKSVMSLGVPPSSWVMLAFLSAVSAGFMGAAVYQLWSYRRGEAGDVEV